MFKDRQLQVRSGKEFLPSVCGALLRAAAGGCTGRTRTAEPLNAEAARFPGIEEKPMGTPEKRVDGYRFLPPSLAAWIRAYIPAEEFSGTIPWKPLSKPLSESTTALVTSGGISLKTDPPFDMEREKNEPTWGDRSFRAIPSTASEKDVNANHLHINTDYILRDINVILPLGRMKEFEEEGRIGRLAPTAYSFYGFQWQTTEFLNTAIAPMTKSMREEGVDVVLLTPA
jgi:D-proline reductase (dithiol) PrdB